MPLPGRGGQTLGEDIGAGRSAAAIDPDPGGAGNGQHVADAAGLHGSPQLRVLAVSFVAGHPGGGDAGVQRGGDHLPGQAGLGRELHPLGYPGRMAALGIGAPGVLGQVEPAVDQVPSPAPCGPTA